MKPEEAIPLLQRGLVGEIYDEKGYLTALGYEALDAIDSSNCPTLVQKEHGECKTCKHYVPYMDQFSYIPRGDGYCNSTITSLEGNAFINCHDEWYCANYEREGDEK